MPPKGGLYVLGLIVAMGVAGPASAGLNRLPTYRE